MDFNNLTNTSIGQILTMMNNGEELLNLITQINGNSDFQNQTLYDESPIKNVVSEKGKEQLKKIKYSKDVCNNTSCAILHIDFEEDEEIIVLPCNHGFNSEAITKWVSDEKAECPICRFKLDSIEKKNETNNSTNASVQPPVYTPSINITNINNIFTPENSFNENNIFNENYVPLTQRFRNNNTVIYNHPFGPRIERVASIISEDDDNNDLMRAINMVRYNNTRNVIRNIYGSGVFNISLNHSHDISANLHNPSLD